MRYIKNIHLLYLLIAFALFNISKAEAQVTLYSPFEGTWEHVEGNEKFIVSLWKEKGNLLGHYKMVYIDNNTTELVYNSHKLYSESSELKWPPVINMYFTEYSASGVFIDNTINSENITCISGDIKLNIQQSSPLTMHWEIKKGQGIRSTNEPELNIPIDIILTKVSNEVDLD